VSSRQLVPLQLDSSAPLCTGSWRVSCASVKLHTFFCLLLWTRDSCVIAQSCRVDVMCIGLQILWTASAAGLECAKVCRSLVDALARVW
jgi:hypothetical protein